MSASHIVEGFMLGLSMGVVCLAYCGPVILPYILGEGNSIKKNSASLALFLAGRLIAYILFGIIAGKLGSLLLQPSKLKLLITGLIYLALALLMIIYGFYRFREICLGKIKTKPEKKIYTKIPALLPFTGGLITGLNICPPFLLAITNAVNIGNVSGSLLMFLMFYLGTSIYFIPITFIGFFKKQHILRIVGKFAAIITGIYYFWQAIFMLIEL